MSEPESAVIEQHEDSELDLANNTTEELQNTDEVIEAQDNLEPENVDEKPAEVTEKFQKQMNKKHFQFKEEERKRIALETELNELRAKSEAPAQVGPVEIPPIPDPFDDAYEQKIRTRDQAIAASTEWRSQENRRANQEAQQLQTQQRAEETRQQELNETLSKNIEASGIDSEKVLAAHDTLGKYGVEPETANFLLTDEDGPAISIYFQNNLQEFDHFMQQPPMVRGTMIAELKTKASAYKPKTTNAPDPAPSISGRTSPPLDGLKGIKIR